MFVSGTLTERCVIPKSVWNPCFHYRSVWLYGEASLHIHSESIEVFPPTGIDGPPGKTGSLVGVKCGGEKSSQGDAMDLLFVVV